MPERIILHLDLDYFYAQCEEVRHPEYRGKPIVVCVYSGRTEHSGAVATTNYEARKLGVKAGIPIFRAKKILEGSDAIFIARDMEHYEEVSSRVMEIAGSNADVLEQVGIDEAYLDVTKSTSASFEKALRHAERSKVEIRSEVGLTCSVGIGPNKLLAKIASDLQKPDGLTLIQPDQVQRVLFPLPVEKIPGIGVKTQKKLSELGVQTIAELAGYDSGKLEGTFGKTLGRYFSLAARGIDDEPVKPREVSEQISKISTLKQNTRDMELIQPELQKLAIHVCESCEEQGLVFRSVGVIAIMDNLVQHTKTKTLTQPVKGFEIIASTASELFRLLLSQATDREVRRVGVKLSGLSKAVEQETLSGFLSPKSQTPEHTH